MLKRTCTRLTFALLFFSCISAQTRFINPVFTNITTTKDITYAVAQNYLGAADTLQLDYYSPVNDTMKYRPLIVIIHGGGFTSGTRDDAYCVAVATYFAHTGYSCASIKYRLGIDYTKMTSTQDAQQQFSTATYRAIQDTRSAVRFLKANAAQYSVDTSKIFLCGYSAGAVTAVHYAHMQLDEFLLQADTAALGNFDIGDNLTVSPSIAGYISYAGAILDTNWINANEPPFCAFHGTADVIIPYTSGPAYSIALLPPIFGSYPIHTTATRLGITNKLVTYTDSTHAFPTSPTLLPLTLDTASAFLYSLIGNISVRENFFASPMNKNYFMPENMLSHKSYNLNGRKMSTRNAYPQGIYITNYKNADNRSHSSADVFLKCK